MAKKKIKAIDDESFDSNFLEEWGVEIEKEIDEEEKKKDSLFTYFFNISNKKIPLEEVDLNVIESYMLTEFLTGSFKSFPLAMMFNHFHDIIPSDIMYKIAYRNIPKGTYIEWMSKAQSEEQKELEKKLDILQDYYCINKSTAKEYLELLTEEEFEKIKKKTISSEGKK